MAHRHSRSYFDAFIEKLSKRLPAKSADEIEAKFKAQDERAARYDAMEQQLKALTTMMQAVAQIRGDPEAKGGFDADKAVVAQLATPVIYNELTKKMPVPHTEPARLLALDEAGLTGEALEARIANNDEIRGVVAEAMALTGDDVAWVGAVQKDKQTIIRGEFRESAPDAVVDGFTGPREMTQCQHVIASGASRDVRCATSFESDGDVLSMNAPEFTAIGKAGHAFGLIQALGERAMDESVPDAELLHGEELPTTVGGIRKMMGIMMDEDTRYRGVPVKVCGENVCTLCTMGKGEGDVAQLEALAVKAGEILEKQMPKATPVTAQEPDAPTTDDVGAWLKARRLGKFADGLLGMGVECVEDLHDVEPEDCIALGMSHIQQNRLRKELAKLET